MSSPFAPIVKLKKEELDEAQRHLLQINKKIDLLQLDLVAIHEELLALKQPKQGSVALFAQFALMAQACHDQSALKKEALHQAARDRNMLQDRVNKAHTEYEKFLYLHEEVERKILEKLKKQEANYLDEIAVMGYNLQQGKTL